MILITHLRNRRATLTYLSIPPISPDQPHCGRARRSLIAADYWIGVSLPNVVNALGIRGHRPMRWAHCWGWANRVPTNTLTDPPIHLQTRRISCSQGISTQHRFNLVLKGYRAADDSKTLRNDHPCTF